MAFDDDVPKNPGQRDDRAVGGFVFPEVPERFGEPRAEGQRSLSVSEFSQLCREIRGESADLGEAMLALRHNIDRYDGERVTYHYRSHRTERTTHETVDVITFIGRMIQHTRPKGFKRIRYYGVQATKTFAKVKTVNSLRTPGTAKEEKAARKGCLFPCRRTGIDHGVGHPIWGCSRRISSSKKIPDELQLLT